MKVLPKDGEFAIELGGNYYMEEQNVTVAPLGRPKCFFTKVYITNGLVLCYAVVCYADHRVYITGTELSTDFTWRQENVLMTKERAQVGKGHCTSPNEAVLLCRKSPKQRPAPRTILLLTSSSV
ncbi:hypothetical protein Y1Q_0021025 [Alligator mississippiensis]|uniref:Uncharacterized protein n=1 Tax=Alligator mississippiensis TaxID=8496 RepID=A0A151M5Q1_ALLMI|nr:hypothetical protein Y1Q_0021025 [Alligator mississippiensis]